jgi:hypothetical protein
MSQPILEIKADTSSAKVTPNLLPCRVHHDGAIGPTEAFWAPDQGTGEFDQTTPMSAVHPRRVDSRDGGG